jgi:hypothetical protein
LRLKSRWDIAAIVPIRTINMYIFIVSPGLGWPLNGHAASIRLQ